MMTHTCVTHAERLATPGELAGLRAQGIRPAPRRQLTIITAPGASPAYNAWPILVIVTMQVAGLAAVVAR